MRVLFDESEPSVQMESSLEIKWSKLSLNNIQRDAVRFALNQREVSIIHGPPGTGKTTCVTELVYQAVQRKMKVICVEQR